MPRKSFFADLERVQRPGGVDSCISGMDFSFPAMFSDDSSSLLDI